MFLSAPRNLRRVIYALHAADTPNCGASRRMPPSRCPQKILCDISPVSSQSVLHPTLTFPVFSRAREVADTHRRHHVRRRVPQPYADGVTTPRLTRPPLPAFCNSDSQALCPLPGRQRAHARRLRRYMEINAVWVRGELGPMTVTPPPHPLPPILSTNLRMASFISRCSFPGPRIKTRSASRSVFSWL